MMTRRTVARGVLLSAGIAATLVLAGCGGHTNASGTAGPTTSAAAGATGSNLGAGTTFIPASTTIAPPPAATTTTAPAGGAGAAGVPAVKPSGPTECKVANLKLSLGPTDGAAGHVYQPLRFTNKSGTTCTIVGFPGVSYVTGDNGKQVGAPAQRDGAKGAAVTLKPGATASAIITMTDVGVFDANTCKPTTTRGLRVYPPDETASMFVASTGTGCAGTPPSAQLRVQTIKPGLGTA